MRAGILGSSDVAKSLGHGFLKEGHEVMLGSREPAKLASWVRESGKRASSGTFSETAKFGQLMVLAVHGTKSVEAIQTAGVENFTGKTVIDATNPLDMSGRLPRLVGALGSSSGELIQKALPKAWVVKAFNTVGNAHFYKPEFPGGPPDMFLCGGDAKAKELPVLSRHPTWIARPTARLAQRPGTNSATGPRRNQIVAEPIQRTC